MSRTKKGSTKRKRKEKRENNKVERKKRGPAEN